MDRANYILVGRLGRARGVKGNIYVTPLTDFPDRFVDLKEIFVDDQGSWQRMVIESTQMIGGRPVLKLQGIDTPEAAGRLTNHSLAIPADQLAQLPEGSYWVFDLVDCEVFDNITNESIGKVVDVLRYPANDAYLIRDDAGRELLLPAVNEYVKEIDLQQRRIVVQANGLVEQSRGSASR